MNKPALRLSNLFDYRPLKKYEGLIGGLFCRAPSTYVGVEVELENVTWKVPVCPSSFNVHDDGSLKIKGQEIVTVPIPFGYLEQELARLIDAIEAPLISSRCSIHVHLNVRNLSVEQLYKFVLLYLIFERNLFKVSGNRYKNNFCVPLHSYPPIVANFLKTHDGEDILIAPDWNKYSALNLCPIWGGETRQVLGTAEFRHMEGTIDIPRIINWINFIVSLKIAATQIDKKELLSLITTMNTTSHYYWLADFVFKGFSKQITSLPSFKGDIEQDILSTKVMLFNTEKKEEKTGTKPNRRPEAEGVTMQWGQVFTTANTLRTATTIDTINITRGVE